MSGRCCPSLGTSWRGPLADALVDVAGGVASCAPATNVVPINATTTASRSNHLNRSAFWNFFWAFIIGLVVVIQPAALESTLPSSNCGKGVEAGLMET